MIEFKDDSQPNGDEQASITSSDIRQHKAGAQRLNGQVVSDLAGTASSCFSQALLRDRDDLSTSSSAESQSTVDREERRGIVESCGPQNLHYSC